MSNTELTSKQYATMMTIYRTTGWLVASALMAPNAYGMRQEGAVLRKWATVIIGDGC